MSSNSSMVVPISMALAPAWFLNSNHLAEAALAVWAGPPQAATTKMIATTTLTPQA